MLLISLPFAGGHARSYQPVEAHLDRAIQVHAIELPGRGRRFQESLMPDLQAMVDDVVPKIAACLATSDSYAIFGHSMGAKIGLLAAQTLRDMDLPPPCHILVSGAAPPSSPVSISRQHLSDDGLSQVLKEMGGASSEALQEPEIMELWLPVLRSDFAAVENYAHRPRTPLSCPISVLHGREDEIPLTEAKAWREHTIGRFLLHELDGGHFFLFERPAQVARIFERALL